MWLLANFEVPATAEAIGGWALLLLIAVATQAASKWLRVPVTILLVLVGMGLAAVADLGTAIPLLGLAQVQISPELIMFVFLPALVFASAYEMDGHALRQDLGPIMALATPGLILSTVLAGLIISYGAGISLPAALFLGALLSETDPIAVVAIFKELGVARRLTMLVEGESLFNDATSIVFAQILLTVMAAGTLTASTVLGGVGTFVHVFVGGLLVGALLGWLAALIIGRVESDPFIEITLTTILAYLSFLLAEVVLHVSGVMATVAAGLVLGGWGRVRISPSVRDYLEHFWEYVSSVATALIFLMVGLRIHLAELWNSRVLLAWVIVGMLVSRAAVVYGLIPLVNRLPGAEQVTLRHQTVLFWGGLRGVLALALVLSVSEFPGAEQYVNVVIGAVLFTLLVQGLSIRRLVCWLGLDRPTLADRFALLETNLAARQRIVARLPELKTGGLFSGRIVESLERQCTTAIAQTQSEIAQLRGQELDERHEQSLLFLRGFAEEMTLYVDMLHKGHLGERAFRRLGHSLGEQIDACRRMVGPLPIERRRTHWLDAWLIRTCERLPGMGWLARRQRLTRFGLDYQRAWARYLAADRTLAHIDELAQLESTPEAAVEQVRIYYARQYAESRVELDQFAEQFPEFVTAMQERLAQRMLLIAESDALHEEAAHGTIPEGVLEQIEERIEHDLRRLRTPHAARLGVQPIDLIRRVPLFAELNPVELDQLASRLRELAVAENEVIVRQGEHGDSLLLIARGVVRVSHEDPADGSRRDLATILAGDFFGEMALIESQPRSATVWAVTPCLLYELRRPDIEAAMVYHPGIRQGLAEASRQRRKEQLEKLTPLKPAQPAVGASG